MTKAKTRNATDKETLIKILKEVRLRLRDIDQKLEHLIESNRRFRFTSHPSDSSLDEFLP